jgi:hypothetical protein
MGAKPRTECNDMTVCLLSSYYSRALVGDKGRLYTLVLAVAATSKRPDLLSRRYVLLAWTQVLTTIAGTTRNEPIHGADSLFKSHLALSYQEFPNVLWKLKLYCLVNKIPQVVSTLSQIDPRLILIFEIQRNIIHPPTSCLPGRLLISVLPMT